MSKLIKITATWAMNEQSDTWDGECLVDENGYFEGIAFDTGSLLYTGERFLFGIYFPDQLVNFFKITPLQISAPLIFRAKSVDTQAKVFVGEFAKVILYGEELLGEVTIIVEEIEKEHDDVIRMIAEYKEEMDEYNRAIYDINFQNKETWFQILNEEK